MKQLVVFDLDGTLAESKSALDEEMAGLMRGLLAVTRVAVISGGDFPQFEAQVLAHLGERAQLNRLSLLPTCGTKFYEYRAGWRKLYAEDFNDAERAKIMAAFKQVITAFELGNRQIWGEQLEDRGSQITFSALGQKAPLDAKKSFDPDFSKRKKMKAKLDQLLPDLSVHLGGTTSIDVTKPGIDKAYGIRKLRDTLQIPIPDMVFIGDALFPGGNDYPAKEAGVVSIQVQGPSETKRVIETLIACLGPAPSA
jgi:HAD superfamily hydrolase (TIGR01484 family)